MSLFMHVLDGASGIRTSTTKKKTTPTAPSAYNPAYSGGLVYTDPIPTRPGDTSGGLVYTNPPQPTNVKSTTGLLKQLGGSRKTLQGLGSAPSQAAKGVVTSAVNASISTPTTPGPTAPTTPGPTAPTGGTTYTPLGGFAPYPGAGGGVNSSGGSGASAQQAPQQPVFDLSAFQAEQRQQWQDAMTVVQGQLADLIESTKNDTGAQALISHWMGQMTAQIDALEKQIIGQLQTMGTENDPVLQSALATLREQFEMNRAALLEDMNARGLAQSGVMLEMEDRLNRGMLSESQRMIAGRLEEMQNMIISTLMGFAQQRLGVMGQGMQASIQADQAMRNRLAQIQSQGLGMVQDMYGQMMNQNLALGQIANQNQQAGYNREHDWILQQSQQQFTADQARQNREFQNFWNERDYQLRQQQLDAATQRVTQDQLLLGALQHGLSTYVPIAQSRGLDAAMAQLQQDIIQYQRDTGRSYPSDWIEAWYRQIQTAAGGR